MHPRKLIRGPAAAALNYAAPAGFIATQLSGLIVSSGAKMTQFVTLVMEAKIVFL